MNNLEKELRIVSSQKYNGKTLEERTKIAKENLERREILNSISFCTKKEMKFASNLLNEYLKGAKSNPKITRRIHREIFWFRLTEWVKSINWA